MHGIEVLAHIQKRTARGIDKDGKPFKPYSTSYKESINKGQAKPKNSTNVNLQKTGKMLSSIRWETIKKGLRFYLEGSRKSGKKTISNNDVAYHNKMNGREFLGLEKKYHDKLKEDIRDTYYKILNK